VVAAESTGPHRPSRHDLPDPLIETRSVIAHLNEHSGERFRRDVRADSNTSATIVNRC
jgi:hypothetical protein